MGRYAVPIGEKLLDYIVAHSIPPDNAMDDLASETESAFPHLITMQIGPEQCAFMTLLTQIVGVRHAVEIGTFTGMSSIAIARGLLPGGKLTCMDTSEEFTAVARKYWERAGLGDRIDLQLGDAHDLVNDLPAEPYLDLAFIDADKNGYVAYWDALVPRMRGGGVILVDNTLYSGEVADSEVTDATIVAIRAFNARAVADERVDLAIAPIGDGLTIARKR
jgi:caffeoyl-CoA O-methyltransferase